MGSRDQGPKKLASVHIDFFDDGSHSTKLTHWDKIPRGLAGLQRALNRAPAEYLTLRSQAAGAQAQRERQAQRLVEAQAEHEEAKDLEEETSDA